MAQIQLCLNRVLILHISFAILLKHMCPIYTLVSEKLWQRNEQHLNIYFPSYNSSFDIYIYFLRIQQPTDCFSHLHSAIKMVLPVMFLWNVKNGTAMHPVPVFNERTFPDEQSLTFSSCSMWRFIKWKIKIFWQAKRCSEY